MKTVIILVVSLFSFTIGATTLPSLEKQALIDLYYATNGDNWTESWDLNASVEHWKGVTIIDNKVVALKLTNNNLNGELPASIGNLVNLKVLNLHNNTIQGNIPTSIGNLGKLISLNISLNTLQGNVPEEISKIKSLEYLYIYSNDFTGFLPTEINTLPNLRSIRMYATSIETNTTNTFAVLY
ncbi:hypothetical protein [Dokdonia sp.]|uniref:leucine-rich repeat domain-containing protein n=1 Tax=Dokdonia sp. TaxID=2024995 RepID=UPI003263AFD6